MSYLMALHVLLLIGCYGRTEPFMDQAIRGPLFMDIEYHL